MKWGKPLWWPTAFHDDRWVSENYTGPWWFNALLAFLLLAGVAVIVVENLTKVL